MKKRRRHASTKSRQRPAPTQTCQRGRLPARAAQIQDSGAPTKSMWKFSSPSPIQRKYPAIPAQSPNFEISLGCPSCALLNEGCDGLCLEQLDRLREARGCSFTGHAQRLSRHEQCLARHYLINYCPVLEHPALMSALLGASGTHPRRNSLIKKSKVRNQGKDQRSSRPLPLGDQ